MLSPLLMLLIGRQLFPVTRRSLCRIAARYNLGLAPPGVPSDCQGCKEKNKLNTDPYHYLSCTRHKRQEITIGHNMLVHVVYTYNSYTGGTGVKEPSDLHGS